VVPWSVPHLSLAQVYGALAYYQANREEMDEHMAAEEAESDRTPSTRPTVAFSGTFRQKRSGKHYMWGAPKPPTPYRWYAFATPNFLSQKGSPRGRRLLLISAFCF
jgi:hypothetical protein